VDDENLVIISPFNNPAS